MKMKVLVLDLTHGGDVLAEEYLSQGGEVTAVDIYRNSAEAVHRLEAMGVRCPIETPAEDYDLAVVPVHAPLRFMGPAKALRTITHHQAVGELARFSFPTVEVTGTKGKTSTCHLLSFLLADQHCRVLSLTSSGLWSYTPEVRVLEERVSIAPATLLRVSKEHGGYDLGVMEVSLGGSGLASVGVITGLQEDYPIAGGMRKAWEGKVQMVRSARGRVVYPVSEAALWRNVVPRDVEAITFGQGGDVDVELRLGELGGPAISVVRSGQERREYELRGGYIHSTYRTALACALAVVKALGRDPIRAARRLSDYRGLAGRCEVSRHEWGVLVRERNPGISAASLEFQLGTLVHEYGCRDIGLVLDPVNRRVCEKLELSRVRQICDRIPQVRGRYLLSDGTDTAKEEGFHIITGMDEVLGNHSTLLWATKEGYL